MLNRHFPPPLETKEHWPVSDLREQFQPESKVWLALMYSLLLFCSFWCLWGKNNTMVFGISAMVVVRIVVGGIHKLYRLYMCVLKIKSEDVRQIKITHHHSHGCFGQMTKMRPYAVCWEQQGGLCQTYWSPTERDPADHFYKSPETKYFVSYGFSSTYEVYKEQSVVVCYWQLKTKKVF